MKKFNLNINFGNQTVSIKDQTLTLGSDTIHQCHTDIDHIAREQFYSSLRETITIPPHTSVRAKCIASPNAPEGEYIVTPSDQAKLQGNIGVNIGATFLGSFNTEI